MTLDDVTMIMPTMGRKEMAQAVLKAIHHRPFFVVINEEHAERDTPEMLYGARVILVKNCQGMVQANEAAILDVKTKLITGCGDDLVWEDGESWVAEGLRVYNEQLGERDGVVALNDGTAAPGIACYPLISKKFYMENCYPSPYKNYYVDCEWTERARKAGVYAFADQARIRHHKMHPKDGDHNADGHIFYQRNRGA